jgi:RNA binding exosome subunit
MYFTVKVHHATVSAFCGKDGVAALKDALKAILPSDAAVEESVIEPETEGGVFLKELVELKAHLTKQPDIREFAKKVLGSLDEYDKKRVRERLEDYVDDDCCLYLRLSKTEAASGSLVLEYKDPIHATFKLAAYPAKRENALASARELLDEML